MRKAFSEWITNKADKDKNIILIVGDIGYKIFDKYRSKFPDRFINIGICEQSMIGVAAGMALKGLKPYVYTITPFLIERPYEQIKVDIYCNNVNVKLVGYADYPRQGPTHRCFDEHILDKMFQCYYPNNSKETLKYLDSMYSNDKPAFISLKRDKLC